MGGLYDWCVGCCWLFVVVVWCCMLECVFVVDNADVMMCVVIS